MLHKLKTTGNGVWVYRTGSGTHQFTDDELKATNFTTEEADVLIESFARHYRDQLIKVTIQ